MAKKVICALIIITALIDEWAFDHALIKSVLKGLVIVKDWLEYTINTGVYVTLSWYGKLFEHAPITGVLVFLLFIGALSLVLQIVLYTVTEKQTDSKDKEVEDKKEN